MKVNKKRSSIQGIKSMLHIYYFLNCLNPQCNNNSLHDKQTYDGFTRFTFCSRRTKVAEPKVEREGKVFLWTTAISERFQGLQHLK